jgi:hypothetical protein
VALAPARRESRAARWVCLVTALILVAASLLKTYDVASIPQFPRSGADWLYLLVIQGEFLLGVWLLSGLARILAWRVAVGCFVAFALLSFYQAIQGAPSCNCMGAVPMSPWYSLSLDLAVLGALCYFPPRSAHSPVTALPS